MNSLLLLIILIYQKMLVDGALISPNQYKHRSYGSGIRAQRSRRDSPLAMNSVAMNSYSMFSRPADVISNSITPSSVSICPKDPPAYFPQSIVVGNMGSQNGITVRPTNIPNAVGAMGQTRGSDLVFENIPPSKCYVLNFPSPVSAYMNLQVQFYYNTSYGAPTTAVGPSYGSGSYVPPTMPTPTCGKINCQNGGVCQVSPYGYQCQCNSNGQWLGNDCSIPNPCLRSTCSNGKVCYYFPDGRYYCQCPNGYTGDNCQYASPSPAPPPSPTYFQNDPCSLLRPCQNGANCVLQGNQVGYACVCPPGYSGVNCELPNRPTVTLGYCGSSSYGPPLPDPGRIVNGISVASHTWPWIVSIQTSTGQHFCGGTLVDTYHVITAAHCFISGGTSPNSYKIVAGLLNMRQQYAPGVQQLPIQAIYRHEQFDEKRLSNDITVIKLRQPAQITATVYPICLPDRSGAQDPKPYSSVLIAGWGYTDSVAKTLPDQLQQATIQIFNLKGGNPGQPNCGIWERSGYKLNEGQQLCALSSDTLKDSCQGDSGGPLIGAVQSTWYLFGIVSYGSAICGRGTDAGVYTRVSGYMDWIRQKLAL